MLSLSVESKLVATLTVRKLEDDVVQRLRERARRHGRSVEAETRSIIREAVGAGPTTAEWIDAMLADPISDVIAGFDADKLRDRDDNGRVYDWP